MRKIVTLAAIAAVALLSACVFESAAPLIPPEDYATPLTTGNYAVMQRQDSGEFIKDSEAKLSIEKNSYTLTSPDGPMRFALYRVSPKTYLGQVSEKPEENVYVILETTPEGAAVTTLQCQQLNTEERTRFHLSADTKDSCVFSNLDDLVTAAIYLKGRGETPSMKLVRQ